MDPEASLPFAYDLFNFIWRQCKVPEEELYLGTETGNSEFSETIGRAIVCTQLIFKEEFELIFKKYATLKMKEDRFSSFVNECVDAVVPVRNIIDRTVASCMIYAEFTLFQRRKGNREYLEYLLEAPKYWSDYFRRNLKEAFDAAEGWQKLREQCERRELAFLPHVVSTFFTMFDTPGDVRGMMAGLKNAYLPGYKIEINKFLERELFAEETSSTTQVSEDN